MSDVLEPTEEALKARLYYEAHITVDALEDEHWESFKAIMGDDWKVSRFDVDEVDGCDGKWFASARHQYLNDIKIMCGQAFMRLILHGVSVQRIKIEDTVMDTNHGDGFEDFQ